MLNPLTKVIMAAITVAVTTIQTVHAAGETIDFNDPKNKLDKVVELPIKKLSAVEAGGEIMFISSNGRFVVKGQIYDIWYKKSLDNMAEIEDSATKVHFDKMQADFSQYNTITIGKGEKHVALFVDPNCGICHKLIKDAEKLTDEYTFNIVVIPALGDESAELSKKLFCAEDSSLRLEALMNNAIETLKVKENCDMTNYNSTLYLATILGIDAVPYSVAHDGRIQRGYIGSLEKWLGNK